jgi:hypothetical protein
MPVTTSPLPSSPAQVNQSSGDITLPLLLANPTRIQRDIAAVATANYWADRLLPNGGGVSGGGVIFDIAAPGDSYSSRDPETIAPASEFPIVNAAEPIPGTAKVAKWGSKIKVPDEKRDRNDMRWMTREERRQANSLVRQLHRAAISTVDAAVTAFSRTDTWTTAFGSVVVTGDSPTLIKNRPAADVQAAQAVADAGDYEVTYDTLLVNTLDYAALMSIYPEFGIDQGIFPGVDGPTGTVIPTNLIAQGTSYLVASNEAGETRWEKPLGTVVIREEKIETNWVQSGARVVYFVDNPYAILKFTGG